MVEWIVGDVFTWEPPVATKLIICDPPYGTGKIYKSFYNGVPDLDDTDPTVPQLILQRLLEFRLPLCFFCDPLFPFKWSLGLSRVPCPKRVLVWKTSWISGFKSSATLPRQVDLILCYETDGRGVLTVDGKTLGNLIDSDKLVAPVHKSYVKKKGGLPVEKGTGIGAVLAQAFSNPGDLVVDMCCGTGSLAFGALSTGRKVVGVDIEPAYIARAKELEE